MVGGQIYTVTQVNRHIKDLLDHDHALQGIMVRGELSNYKTYPSGHHYFTLKDREGALSGVMFRSAASKLRFRPENGMKVILFGSVTAYPRDGKYQFYCQQLILDGQGDLHLAFEQLKQKLYEEGLFDPSHKKPIPTCPDSIAIITSAAGAAVHDMLRILKARWPLTTIKLMSVRVQGAEAPAELVGAVRYANRWKVADLIIIGRGGGSMEDLWAFNDERLARAIYDSEIPVISAVGHEPDVVITDYVADLRAATPSNAAELAVPDQMEYAAHLHTLEQRIHNTMRRHMRDTRKRLDYCANSRVLTNPELYLQERQLQLDSLERNMQQAFERILNRQRQRLLQNSAALDAMSPLKVLGRGYSITTLQDGTVVTSKLQAPPGTELSIRLKEGSLLATVEERN